VPGESPKCAAKISPICRTNLASAAEFSACDAHLVAPLAAQEGRHRPWRRVQHDGITLAPAVDGQPSSEMAMESLPATRKGEAGMFFFSRARVARTTPPGKQQRTALGSLARWRLATSAAGSPQALSRRRSLALNCGERLR